MFILITHWGFNLQRFRTEKASTDEQLVLELQTPKWMYSSYWLWRWWLLTLFKISHENSDTNRDGSKLLVSSIMELPKLKIYIHA